MGQAFVFDIPDLRLGEFDLGGVLYHANYFHIYEMAREALLASGHCPYSELVTNGSHLAVVEAHLEYQAPIRYGQALRCHVSTRDIQRTSATLCYEIEAQIKSPSFTVVHKGWTRLVFVQIQNNTFRPQRFPERLETILRRIAE